MNILVIGSGGREHALGWKLRQSQQCRNLFFMPGNAGTAALGQNVPIKIDRIDTRTVDAIDLFCRQEKIELVVIGPEEPLAQGLADRLARPGRFIFGPTAAAARIEADKAWAKQLMRSASVPTAEARIFTDPQAAAAYIRSRNVPLVVKASGLAKGKGAIVCDDPRRALAAVEDIMVKKIFGEAGETVVIEEKLVGQEVSVLALVDGRDIYVLDPSQDHKPVGENDTGPNTGGMGAYSPTPLVDEALMNQISREILVPTVDALRREGIIYQGVLYAGLMLTPGGPKVIEFNCRFGDPETQSLLPRLQGDLVEIMLATCQGRVAEVDLSWDERYCCCVVIASGGYPGPYRTGLPIEGLDSLEAEEDLIVFHAGTARNKDGQLVTAGGRVLNVCALAPTLKEAQAKANAACEKIRFEGAYFRRDIGFRVMRRES